MPGPTRPRVLQALGWSAAVLLAIVGARTAWLLHESTALVRASTPLQRAPGNAALRVLVVGDSTAVGTGASLASGSVVGRLAQAFAHLRIDNRGRDGARFADVLLQLDGDERVDMVLVMAGGNDVVRLRRLPALKQDVERVVQRARQRSDLVVLMPAGNVGNAPFFLPPLSQWMTWRSRRLHAIVDVAATRHGALVVDLFREAADDPFVKQPQLNAADGLHPSDAGYAVWFGELMAQADLPRRLGVAR